MSTSAHSKQFQPPSLQIREHTHSGCQIRAIFPLILLSMADHLSTRNLIISSERIPSKNNPIHNSNPNEVMKNSDLITIQKRVTERRRREVIFKRQTLAELDIDIASYDLNHMSHQSKSNLISHNKTIYYYNLEIEAKADYIEPIVLNSFVEDLIKIAPTSIKVTKNTKFAIGKGIAILNRLERVDELLLTPSNHDIEIISFDADKEIASILEKEYEISNLLKDM